MPDGEAQPAVRIEYQKVLRPIYLVTTGQESGKQGRRNGSIAGKICADNISIRAASVKQAGKIRELSLLVQGHHPLPGKAADTQHREANVLPGGHWPALLDKKSERYQQGRPGKHE
jgi:hypothetical protein